MDRTVPPEGRGRLRGFARDALLVLVLFGALRAYQLRDAASGVAPSFTRQCVDGQHVRVPDAEGAPTLVYFWATWCGTCSAMRGNVAALARTHRVISVASQSGGQAALATFAHAHGIAFPVIADDGALLRAFGVRAFPTAFVVDGDGDIRHVEVGYTTELGLALRMWLARVL